MSRSLGQKISIVVPVYNSEDCLLQLNEEITRAMAGFYWYELILVNDCSTDGSWEIIKKICEVNPCATGIKLRKNSGQDNAILAGLRAVSGEFAVIMDDDLQHAPGDIVKLLSKCKDGFDVCYGYFQLKKQSRWKNLGSWVNGKLAERLLRKPKGLYLSPFKMIRREVVDELVRLPGPFPYIDAALLTITSSLSQVEVEHHSRFKGKGNYGLAKSALVFVRHLTNYSVYPLRLVSVLGFVSSLVAFVLGIFYLVQYFTDRHRVEGWITLVILLTFFGGMILLSLGLIGEYVGRSFIALNGTPQYVIEKIITKNNE
jgi:glycosyltransferase involved in cell wall biosynthesis